MESPGRSLVIGADGFVGRHLVRALLARGDVVEQLSGGASDPASLRAMLTSSGTVYCLTEKDCSELFATPQDASGGRIICYSSTSHAAGASIVAVHPAASPVGPCDAQPTRIGRIITHFLNWPAPIYCDANFDLIAVEDVAQGLILAADGGTPGQQYVLGGRAITMRELFTVLGTLKGRSGPGLRVPRGLARLVFGEIAPTCAVPPGISTPPPGLRLTSVKNALARAVCWFCNHGYVRGRVAARLRLSPDALAAISEPDPIDAPAP